MILRNLSETQENIDGQYNEMRKTYMRNSTEIES
jgi:hypothetical protein